MASVRKMSLNNTWRMATLGAIALAVLISSCGGEGGRSLEERAQSIDQSLICPVCPGETIDQAQVELAKQMRATVREKLAEGQSKDEILQFFVDRYGQDVLAAPPKSGFNLVAWVVPPAAVTGAGVLLVLVIRNMRKNGEMKQGVATLEEGLEPYLARVDREIGIPEDSQQSEKRG